MKQTLTTKLKLILTPEHKNMVKDVSLAYRDALNYTSQMAFSNKKITNAAKLQKLVYYELRSRYKLPSQMACNVPRQVAATYKGLWTTVEQNNVHLANGYTKKRYKGLDKPPKYVARTCNLNYLRDFSFVKGKVSLITLKGRIKVDYQGYQRHLELIHSGAATIGGGKIWYSKPSKTYYLLISMEVEVPEIEPEDVKRIVGVDVGQRYLAVATDTRNKTQFFSGKQVVHKASRYHRARKSLQLKGTRSATKRLIQLSGRERRFKADTNHCIAKRIASSGSLIGLEDLSNIRERIKPRKTGKKASKKQRRANHNQAKWSFAELYSFVDYKAVMNGSLAIKVDADYTSQACPCCGHTSKENRLLKGLLFSCVQCGFSLHADLVGARNIAMRVLLFRQDWERTGRISAVPNVSGCETKAERLSRYSELRWSLDAIPALNISRAG